MLAAATVVQRVVCFVMEQLNLAYVSGLS